MNGNEQFISDDYYIYYYGQESLRRNGVSLIGKKKKRVQNDNFKNDRTIPFVSKAKHSTSQ